MTSILNAQNTSEKNQQKDDKIRVIRGPGHLLGDNVFYTGQQSCIHKISTAVAYNENDNVSWMGKISEGLIPR